MDKLRASELREPMNNFEHRNFAISGVNTERDEEKIGLILNNGTYVLQIKSLQKEIEAKDREV